MSAPEQPLTERFALSLAGFAIRHPWLLMLAMLLVTVGAASGARHLQFSNNYRVFFSEKNPELIAFDEFQDNYTKNDNLLFVLSPRSGDAFSSDVVAAAEWLTEEAWKTPFVIRVDSVPNFQYSSAEGDDLTVRDLIRDGATLSEAELAERKRIALDEPLLNGRLVTRDGAVQSVNITLQFPEESLEEVPAANNYARGLRAQLNERYPDIDVAISGIAAMNNAFAESGTQDSKTLMPLMFVVLIVFMVVALRSITGAIATLTVVVMSTATALGLAGYLGIELTPISVTAPVIILTLAIADSIHILITMLTLMGEGESKREALRNALRINLTPVVITSVTTIVGFLTLNFSDAPPFWDLGNITAMGIAAALTYSLTFLPAILVVLPIRARVRDTSKSLSLAQRMGDAGGWVAKRYRPVLATLGTATFVLVLFVPTLDLNDEWVKYFDHRTEFRNDADFAIDKGLPMYTVEYSVKAREAEGISEPEYLTNLDEFTEWLRAQPEVLHVYSYTDIIKRLNKNMHGDDPAWHRIPDNRELAAQYLLLYELSLPFGLDLNDRIDIAKSSTRVTASLQDMSTVDTRDFLRKSKEYMATELPEYMRTEPTSSTVMFSYISERNIESMLRGNVLAVVLIALIMILALRSVSLGLLSLLPNALPILVAFGIWALLVGQVGMAAATVSASSLGIVVDDTVHFLAKYLRARREKGFDRPTAIRYAFEMCGTAIVSTTIILFAGFMVLSASTFRINNQLGLLTALVILTALIIDFLLLPALLMLGHRRGEETARVPQPAKA